MAQISAIVLFLARAASLQRAKFRPESVRFLLYGQKWNLKHANKTNECMFVESLKL